MDWSSVVSTILSLSSEGRFEELKDFLVSNGISILDDSPCIVSSAFYVLCIGDSVTVYYYGGVSSGVVAGFSLDGTHALMIGCSSERPCSTVYPATVYLPSVSLVVFSEFSPFHLTYGASMLQEFVGSGGGSGEEG